jgi:4-hydroxybenzoate polyprenyltransferase
MESLPRLNGYGYVATASTVLAATLFVLDGGAYRAYPALCLGVAVLTVAAAMSRSSSTDQAADRPEDDRQNRRRKEMQMESGGYGGNGGG